jgi:hypothetical protein
MTNRGAAVLGIRLLALYLVIQALLRLPGYMAADAEYHTGGMLFAAVILPMLVALVLWAGVRRMADLLMPARRAESIQQPRPAAPEQIQATVFAAVGLFLTVDSLPDLVTSLWRVLEAASLTLTDALSIQLMAESVRTLLGVAIFLGAQGLVGLLNRLRHAGRA